jgi:regulator of sirC expression with transglutaminase-like and TPR domain
LDPSALAFRHVVWRPEEEIDLGAAALLLGELDGAVDVPAGLAVLDELAEGARGPGDPVERLARLTHHLFVEQKFRGNVDDYEDPRNSFLDQVLGRRLGIPISLAVLVLEVGRRVGVRVDGIGFPGHVHVAARLPGGDLLLDCFHGGKALDRKGLEELLANALPGASLSGEHLMSQSKRQILARMLNNLRRVYAARQDGERRAAVEARLEILAESPPGGGGARA